MNRGALTDNELRELAQIFRALGDITRQRILLLLSKQPMNVNSIVANFELAQPTISRHLAVLKNARLVSAVRRRQQIIYHLVPATMRHCCESFLSALGLETV